LLFASISLLVVHSQPDLALSRPPALPYQGLEPSPLAERQRYGFVVDPQIAQWPERFDVAQLRAGWYVDYSRPTCRVSPEGMDRALGISVLDYSTIPPWLGPLVDNHPGAIWLIGNEPDRQIYQAERLPEQYAHDYGHLYWYIKGRDPTARVAAGNIVQPTPFRLA